MMVKTQYFKYIKKANTRRNQKSRRSFKPLSRIVRKLQFLNWTNRLNILPL